MIDSTGRSSFSVQSSVSSRGLEADDDGMKGNYAQRGTIVATMRESNR